MSSPAPLSNDPILITGVAGFIGFTVARQLLAQGHAVLGIDNLNDYYDPKLKRARLAQLQQPAFEFQALDVANWDRVQTLFDQTKPRYVVHLAAQAGVRYAMSNPKAYSDSNLAGSSAILEACRIHKVKHLVFASSSSVYGGNQKVPFSECDAVDHPVSFYAASKRSNELMAHSYSHLYNLPITMLRYFTVYGPWGRPDMAIWKFTDAMLRGQPIDVYAQGRLSRDFTFVEDAAHATIELLKRPSARIATSDPATWRTEGPATSWAPFETFNVGRRDPVTVNELIALLEAATGHTALRNEMPMQAGDVEKTSADTSKLAAAIGFEPRTSLADGLQQFVRWFREYRDLR